MKKTNNLLWGIVLIAVGVVLALNVFNIMDINLFFDGWWTLFIIVPSVVSIFTEKEKLASVGFLSAGIILLLAAQKVITYDMAWKIILPVFLMLIGLIVA